MKNWFLAKAGQDFPELLSCSPNTKSDGEISKSTANEYEASA